MLQSLRIAQAAIPCALALLSLTACSSEETATRNDSAAAPSDPGMIALSADNIARLGLKFAAAAEATEAPIAVVPAIIAPPPNARVAVAATFPGVVTRILVVEGQDVTRGQALAIVSSRDVLSMGADLSRASARLGVAQSSANRLSQLEREGVVAGARADEARAMLGEARADVSEKSRILRMVNGSGASGSYTLTAPIAGKVTAATIHAGSVVDGTTAPYVIDAAGQYEAQAQLPERLAGQVKPGMTVALGDTLRGAVTSVGSTIDPATRSVTLKAKLPAGPGALAGRATNLSLFGPAPVGAVTIDQNALATLADGEAVFVRSAKGVEIRKVKSGGKDADRILILSGLKPGEQVVVAGTSALKPMAMGE
ncbi:membrane fusion protein, cobalt-zinc-cadmium efflux system [Sphingobium sp. AP50]|uniref:efflux RND transporter periplasmic adaptor subunit n=1 Tax=Sphingobium sp. AP50 TaxID=1884369 RepID=UPI0008BD4B09|nr:efflux RND transporter periplasmic adaptor subunit [Sphingobium sp. AP50]SEJ26628.1 membrane fusion protein, cobalt-zinc-cadmium efflux system [Sphingobium sp. AP50]